MFHTFIISRVAPIMAAVYIWKLRLWYLWRLEWAQGKAIPMRNTRYPFLGIIILCTVSIIFCLLSTFLFYETKEKVSTIYKHPYAVSNAAREIHSRALDTNFFYRKLLSSETSDKKKAMCVEKIEEKSESKFEETRSRSEFWLCSCWNLLCLAFYTPS